MLVELNFPVKRKELIVPFSDIGKNGMIYRVADTGNTIWTRQMTMHGHVWIPRQLRDMECLAKVLNDIYQENLKMRSPEDAKAFNRELEKTLPWAKFAGAGLLLILIVFGIYYFTIILPNL